MIFIVKAKRLIILSDIDEFYNSDPRFNKNAKLLQQIDMIDA
ncbi:MAG: hypothetical protein PUF84_03900 [Ruminococcus bromii]|nr:hypothetical protein [Ruminococcus bromii]MDY4711244.1 hypothetical protein [Ruminococcus bromii]